MILKLEMPYYDKAVEKGSIVKWHKSEGDWINFGDDLFDIKVEEITKLKRIKEGQGKTVDMVKGTVSGIEFTIQVTSSDMGFLRKIRAAEGEEKVIGELVALITTSEQEPFDTDEADVAAAPVFRVVTNVEDGSAEYSIS